jgi:hypothetical protein
MSPLDPKLIPIGLPWCREEDYDAFIAMFKNSEDLPGTWNEFIKPYEQAEKQFQAKGQTVKRIYINPRTFRDWCARKGYQVNAKSCERFAAEIAIKEQRNAGGPW